MPEKGSELERTEVRSVTTADEPAWRMMWAAYCAFYETVVPDEVTDSTWRRIMDSDFPFGAIIAVDREQALGFANYVVGPYTWSEQPHCLMEDLYVAQDARSKGVGHMLIQHLLDLCRSENWSELYWITRENNTTARRLYDRFTPPDGFIQYTIELD